MKIKRIMDIENDVFLVESKSTIFGKDFILYNINSKDRIDAGSNYGLTEGLKIKRNEFFIINDRAYTNKAVKEGIVDSHGYPIKKIELKLKKIQ